MIIGGTRGHVFAIDERSGEELWRTRLETGGFLNAASGGDVMVLIRDGAIVAGCNGHTWGLSPTGEVLWHNRLSGLGNGTVCLAAEGVSVQHVHTVTRST